MMCLTYLAILLSVKNVERHLLQVILSSYLIINIIKIILSFFKEKINIVFFKILYKITFTDFEKLGEIFIIKNDWLQRVILGLLK